MIRRCTRLGSASTLAFVGDAEQDRLLGGRAALISLDGRFTPALLLRPLRKTLDVHALDVNIERSGR